jgi:FlgD Ig-like domain
LRRVLPIALVAALLVGTAVAFALTERLKLERSPITKPEITKVFAPLSEGGGTADVGFTLRRRDRITVDIVDAGGERVDTLVTDVLAGKGPVRFTWDGRSASGALVDEGRYRPRVHLQRAHRTIVIPNPIQVALTAPTIRLVTARPRVISPDRDGRGEFVRVRFHVDEPARGLLLVDGRQEVRGRRVQHGGKLNWFGKANGRPLRPGTYTLALRAEDRAGNLSVVTRAVRIRVRYVELPAGPVRVVAGKPFRVRVDTDAKRVRWRLAGRSGRQLAARGLELRAPGKPGTYALYVVANGHADKTAVVVTRPRP